jgi:transposase InsO family protein
MDFIEGLPESEGNSIGMVVTDRLSKDVVFIRLPNLETETVARAFLRHVVAYHGVPNACVSDRESQFVSTLWARLCSRLHIERRLSTAFTHRRTALRNG